MTSTGQQHPAIKADPNDPEDFDVSSEAVTAAIAERAARTLPAGDYAIVEVLGHRRYVGRVSEVERFGSKLLAIEPLFKGRLLDAVMIGGGSIYQFTPCSAEAARRAQPIKHYDLPSSLVAVLPSDLLPAPEVDFAPFFLTQSYHDDHAEAPTKDVLGDEWEG